MHTPTGQGPRTVLIFSLASILVTAVIGEVRSADPPPVAGNWAWTWQDRLGETHRHVLEVEGVGAKLAARELFDDQPAVRVDNLTLDGTTIKFTVVRGDQRADYNGKVADPDHINGTVTVTSKGQSEEYVWKAERPKNAPKTKSATVSHSDTSGECSSALPGSVGVSETAR